MLFYCPTPSRDAASPPNEAKLLSPWARLVALTACAAGGFLYAAALPPLNMSFAAVFALLPVMIYVSLEERWYRCALAGWLWGWCWAICAYRFLREIEWFIPWLMAPVMALFPAVWASMLHWMSRKILFPSVIAACGMDFRAEYLERGPKIWRLILMGVNAAALYVVIEYSRSRLFVWNDLAVTQYRNVAVIQIAALTGSYGVGFGVALANTIWWMLFFRRGWRAALGLAIIVLLWFFAGWGYTAWRDVPVSPAAEWKVLAIQGDLSQRRRATVQQVDEAMTIYEQLSRRGLEQHPEADIMVWPESAIPILFLSCFTRHDIPLPRGADMNARYQSIVRNLCLHYRKKLLFGALDLEEASIRRMKKNDPPLGITNSALLIDEWGGVAGRYDKFHRVPFGEYVPGRKYLPTKLVEMMDMGRDLVPGAPPVPIAELSVLAGQGGKCKIRPGVVICYEGVFGYVTRELLLRGANVLVALSNDAWYPQSSEPEQHLANATLRAVECGIPMVRIGNNSGTGIVMPSGRFAQALEVPGPEPRPEIRRGRGFKLLKVPVIENTKPTYFIRHGDWFPINLAFFIVVMISLCMRHNTRVLNAFVDLKSQTESDDTKPQTKDRA